MKQILLAGASALAIAAGAAWLARRQNRVSDLVSPEPRLTGPAGQRHCGVTSRDPRDSAAITRDFLLYFIVPLWTAAGVADWLCHRASRIEETTGAKESLLHLLMLVEVGVPVLAGVFLEITAPVFALMIASFLLHEATALWDVTYAVTQREVTPIEQHVHSFLELIPLMAISFVAILHWPQFLALFGFGEEKVDNRLTAKRQRLPKSYVAGLLAALIGLEVLPYFEELWRGLTAAKARGKLRPSVASAGDS